ncbi:MAG: FAD-dependent oxidoreductase [Candidatus Limnocylindrales bacterium]
MTTSFWLDRDALRPDFAPLQGDVTADIAIVGGGIAGIASAYALVRTGASVIVLDRGRIAAGASGRNAGFVLGGVTESFVAACRRYGAERARRIAQVTFTARALIRAAIAESRIECDDRWEGSDQLAADDDEWSDLADSAARLAAQGVAVTLDPDQRRVMFADDGCLDPVRFVRGLAAAAAARGARVHTGTTVTAVGPREVRTDSGRATVGSVLVGGWRDLATDTEIGEDDATSPVIQDALDAWLRSEGITAPVTHRWGGTMDFSHDGLPYIGRRADGLFVCGGFTGHGNRFAMAAGVLLATLLRGGSHQDADLFDPERD